MAYSVMVWLVNPGVHPQQERKSRCASSTGARARRVPPRA